MQALYQRSGCSQIDRVIIDLALRWVGQAGPETCVSVNLHPETIIEPGFSDWLAERLLRRGVSQQRLGLEIIEFVDALSLTANLGELRRLRNLGIVVALDDYGTGSSNLGLLAEGLVDQIKLDRSIVKQVACQSRYANLAASVQRMAETLGVEVVAEGLETDVDVRALEAIGVHWGQGYYYGRPSLIDMQEK